MAQLSQHGHGVAWRKVAPVLANAGCAILIPEMRSYGDSDKPGWTVRHVLVMTEKERQK
jgi:hypothetical protein